MKTESLIKALAEDSTPPLRFRSALMIGCVAGAVVAAGLFFATIGVRPDYASVLDSARFFFKFVVTLALAATAIAAVAHVGQPGVRLRPWILALAIVPILVLGGAGAELLMVPQDQWVPRLVGHNGLFCLMMIPLLAAGPLACLLVVLRRGAPSNPGLAGAVAGLAASGIGATFYATHCNDDSPLFVMVWYSVAILLVTAVGYLIGRRALRW